MPPYSEWQQNLVSIGDLLILARLWTTITEMNARLLRPQPFQSPPMRGWPSAHKAPGVLDPNRSLRRLASCPCATPLAFLSRSQLSRRNDWRTNCSYLREEAKRVYYSLGCAAGFRVSHACERISRVPAAQAGIEQPRPLRKARSGSTLPGSTDKEIPANCCFESGRHIRTTQRLETILAIIP
jgi:hypothetical protein